MVSINYNFDHTIQNSQQIEDLSDDSQDFTLIVIVK